MPSSRVQSFGRAFPQDERVPANKTPGFYRYRCLVKSTVLEEFCRTMKIGGLNLPSRIEGCARWRAPENQPNNFRPRWMQLFPVLTGRRHAASVKFPDPGRSTLRESINFAALIL